MTIYDYTTAGGKNLIKEYIDNLPSAEKARILDIRREINESGLAAISKLKTRQLRGKLYEIKVHQNRMMYVLIDSESIAFLNICKKQKRKAEKYEINKAISRGIEEGLL